MLNGKARNEMRKTKQQLILIVSLWLKNENVSDFEAYERRAARLLAKHGGRIERAVRVKNQMGKADDPFEVHVVSFPDERNFAQYLDDAETRGLAVWRDKIISRTEIISGFDVMIY